MSPDDPSLMTGLDPAGLFALAAGGDAAEAGDWRLPGLEEVAGLFPAWKTLGLLGRGGMGAVYHMHQPDLDRDVAVKLLPIEASRDERQVERFRREARVLAKLRHPGIVALHEAGVTAAGHFFFVMEYVDGFPLSRLIQEGKINVPRAIEIVRQVCDALAYAHAAGVVHRDIKPSNILIDPLGHARVADFGLARWDQPDNEGALELSRTGMFMGTPAYTAPEQARDAAHADHRADLYSLGVLLYEMLTGELPRGVFQPPSRKSGSDARLDEVVQRALQERPEDRYQAAADLKKDVTSIREGEPEKVPPVHRRGMLWLLAAVIVTTGSIAVWILLDKPSAPPTLVTNKVKSITPVPASQEQETPALARKTEPITSPPAVPSIAAQPPIRETPPPQPVAPAVTTPVSPTAPSNKAPAARVWSLEPLSPALSPPADLMGLAWRDVMLISSGGAVLLDMEKTIAFWSEARPGETQRIETGAAASAITRTLRRILILDEAQRLWALDPAKGALAAVASGVRSVFPSEHEDLAGVIALDGSAMLYSTLAEGRSIKLTTGGVHEIVVTAAGTVWLLDPENTLLRLASPESSESTRQAPDLRFQSIAAFGEGVIALSDSGILSIIGSEAVPPSDLREIGALQSAGGIAAALDAKGRIVLWGPAVPDAPQRMRLPEGTKRVRLSPRGLIAAW